MPDQSTDSTAQVSTATPVAPSSELPTGVADLDQARRVRLNGYSKFDLFTAARMDPNLTNAEHRAFMALWDYADSKTFEAWPSQGTLARELHLSDTKTAGKRIDALAAKGYLIVKRTGYFDKATGRNVPSLYRLTMPAGAMTRAERKDVRTDIRADSAPVGGVGVTTTPTVGVAMHPTVGVTTTPLTNQETNQETDQKNPAAATAPPPAVSGAVDNSIRYGRDGYDADGTPWESTVKAAFIDWANTTTDAQAETAREKVLELIAARNGDEAADWARDFWSWGDRRAFAIALAPSRADAQYEAGALYARMLNAAAADYLHPVTVLHPPRVHRQQPVAVVDRDAEALAQLDAEAEAAAARGDLLPEFAEFYARQQTAAPVSPQPSPVLTAEDDDAAAEQECAAQVQRDLSIRVAAQEAEDRRQQARARLDARYEAEARRQQAEQQRPARKPVAVVEWTALEDADTVTPEDRAESVAMFAAAPSLDVYTAPEPTPEPEDLTEPTPEDRAEFIRLFMAPAAA